MPQHCIPNTLIPWSANARLVGKLGVGVRCGVGRPLAEAPWQGAGQAVRQRVYMKTWINQTIYVDIANKKLKPGRLWAVTVSHAPPGAVIGDPWLAEGRRMRGQFRYAVAANNNNAAQRPAPQPQPELAAVDPAVAARREELRQRRIRQMAAINARRAERRAAERAGAQNNIVGQVAAAFAAVNALMHNGPPPAPAPAPAPAPVPAPSPLNMYHAAAITPDCTICCDELAATVFTGCGHRCACVSCARRLGSKCPICRKVSHVITIYDA